MRRVSLSFAVVFLLLPSLGWAHRHKAGMEAAYSGADRSKIDGGAFGFEFTLCKERPDPKADPDAQGTFPGGKLPCTKARFYSIVGGVSYVAGRHTEEGVEDDLSQVAFGAGLRFSRKVRSERVQSFTHFLLGRIREKLGTQIDWAFTLSAGVGVEFTLLGHDHDDGWELYAGPRFEMTRILGSNGEWFPQWSFGLGFRIP